jgi:hypothetical protein
MRRQTTPNSLFSLLFVGVCGLAPAHSTCFAVDYRMEKSAEKLPEGIAPKLASQMSGESVTVIRGTTRKICHLWLCKEWEVADFEAQGDVNYPFQPGQLMGVVQVLRKHSDFRDQDIRAGIYTLRYGQQPVDGAHVGTSPTRDFVLLIPSAADDELKPMSYEKMVLASAEVAGTAHPAILSLQRVEGDGPIRHNEEKDWWVARLTSVGRAKKETKPISLDLVVSGQGE